MRCSLARHRPPETSRDQHVTTTHSHRPRQALTAAQTRMLANVDLVRRWAAGEDRPARPCSYCNRCLFHVVEDPLGCYDLSRFDGDRAAMIRELMQFYQPDGFSSAAGTVAQPAAEDS